jgi:hypothetical protein
MSRREIRQALASVNLVAAAALLGGCPLVVLGGAAAIGGGIAYTQLNQAEKTFEAEFARVERAAREALEALEMTPIAREERQKAGMSEERLELTTFARGMKVVIELDRVPPAGVKVRVDAQRGTIQRDKATATEILTKIDELLARA